ncbi:MAG: MarR family transcriptional regulator [Solirubrobacteraceae bacterium]|nr:MarR family transcriptional regulator [Solirubrobacteraceae bacterium]
MTRPELAPTSAADALVRQLYGLSALRRELGRAATREIASHGFTALAAVRRLEPCRVSDIAQELHVDLSVASRQITALVDAGHVERREDPEDRRAHLVSLTDAGFAVLLGAHERMVEQLQHAVADWSDDEIHTLASGIERLVGQFDEQRRAAAVPTTDLEEPA